MHKIYNLTLTKFLKSNIHLNATRSRNVASQGLNGKESACQCRRLSVGWEDCLEEEMATHSSILVWKILWMEETGGLQSMGSQSWTQVSD